MPEQVWMCAKCRSLWKDQESAEKCEKLHKDIKEAIALSWVGHDSSRGFDGHSRQFPDRIKVKIQCDSKMEYDYATYRLERIGPRGL